MATAAQDKRSALRATTCTGCGHGFSFHEQKGRCAASGCSCVKYTGTVPDGKSAPKG